MPRRAGRRLDHLARERRRHAFRVNHRPIALVSTATTIGVVALVAFMGLWKGRDMAYFTAGAGTMAVAFVVWFGIDNVQSRRLFDAAEAERFTAGVLRRLGRQGWRSVDHVEFDRLDVDHVVAGPGGVFAVETKWTNEAWKVVEGRFDNQYASKAVRQCSDGADRIRRLLKGNYKICCDVRPLLVIWGPGRPHIDAPVWIDGVLVVPGQLIRQAIRINSAGIDTDMARSVVEAIAHFTRRRDEYDGLRSQLVGRSSSVAARQSTRGVGRWALVRRPGAS